MAKDDIKQIDIGDLTESVTSAVQRVLAAKGEQALYVKPPRVICGIIFEPQVEAAVERALDAGAGETGGQ